MAEKFGKEINIINNSAKYLDGIDPDATTSPNHVSDGFFEYVNHFVRKEHDEFSRSAAKEGNFDKSSDGLMKIRRSKEKNVKNIVNLRKQVDLFNNNTSKFKADSQNMSKGTSDQAYLINSAVYGNQHDGVHIDKAGDISMLLGFGDLEGSDYNGAKNHFMKTGEWKQALGKVVKLNDMDENAIIQEPFGAKAFVFKLAEKTKVEKDSGKAFDDNWTYNSALNNFTEAGPQATIGTAFADLAGDGQTKSFADMYEDGMKEDYYVHPDTGESLPEGVLWMKDPANADILNKLLAKYVTSVMKDMHGPSINEDTGQVKKSQSQLTQDLIKKYSIK